MSSPDAPRPVPRPCERCLFRIVLWLAFPQSFVESNRSELWYAFVCERRRRSNAGWLGALLFWHEMVGDLAVSGFRVRVGALFERHRQARPASADHSTLTEVETMNANERFKAGESARFWAGVIVGTVFHVALFVGLPEMSAAVVVDPVRTMTVVPGTRVPLPPPPPDLPKPAVPVVSPGLSADVVATIPTLDRVWDSNTLPLPPVARDASAELPEAWTGPVQTYPRLLNRKEVEEALKRHYPPLLREGGIQGTASVVFLIDVDGRVATRRLSESSGMQAFDEAALEVADRMRFAPAMNRDTPVAVWVTFPVRFSLNELE